jgi:hypothetical protein
MSSCSCYVLPLDFLSRRFFFKTIILWEDFLSKRSPFFQKDYFMRKFYLEKIFFEDFLLRRFSFKKIFFQGDFLSWRFFFEKIILWEDFLSRRFSFLFQDLKKIFKKIYFLFWEDLFLSKRALSKRALSKRVLAISRYHT